MALYDRAWILADRVLGADPLATRDGLLRLMAAQGIPTCTALVVADDILSGPQPQD